MKLTSIVKDDQAFNFTGHGLVYNISAMIAVLRHASQEEFKHHVNNERNDIANWIRGVFQLPHVADEIGKITDRDRIIVILEHHLLRAHKGHDHHQTHKHVEQHAIQPSPKKIEHHIHHHQPSQEENVEERLEELDDHISKLGKAIKDVAYHKPHSPAPPVENASAKTLQQGLIEFSFGLLVGIVLGLLLAKSMGLY